MKIDLILISLLLQIVVAGGGSASVNVAMIENDSITNDSYQADKIFSFGPIIISILALGISAWSLKISRTSEKDRQKDIRTAMLTAQLNKRIINEKGHSEFSLEIMNRGKAVARDIEIFIEGKPAIKYQNLINGAEMWGGLGENGLIKELGAGSKVEYPLMYTIGDPARIDIVLQWSDELKEQRFFRGLLLPITVR